MIRFCLHLKEKKKRETEISAKEKNYLASVSNAILLFINVRWNILTPVTSSRFCLYLMNKMRWILIKIRSCAF